MRWYSRESGVRNLEKYVERICRKTCFILAKKMEKNEDDEMVVDGEMKNDKMVDGDDKKKKNETISPIKVSISNLVDFVGHPIFSPEV